jgi:hypothetical protein
MTVAVPELRPAVLSRESAARLDEYLGFRHRVCNLCVFDRDVARVRALLVGAEPVWHAVRADLLAFADASVASAHAEA